MPVGPVVELGPITSGDVSQVSEFLNTHLNKRVSASAWASAIVPCWAVSAPNHGFMLRDGERVVGVHLAFYSEREIHGRSERFCNLGAWCVLEDYRSHGLRLLRALLGQKGYHFTDLSPSGNVVPLNRRLRFVPLDTATALVPNLPWLSGRRIRVTSSRNDIESSLDEPSRRIYRDHESAAAARHLLIVRDDEQCYVIFRKDRRKGLPLFTSILFVSNPALFRAAFRQVSRHLLLRHGALATLAELRIVGERPFPSLMLDTPRPKMFKSDRLRAVDIDYLYSELTCVGW